MIIKTGKELPDNPYGALTLPVSYLGPHGNGWHIFGEIHDDYYEWINHFCAFKGDKAVWGDFEDKVCASDEETYQEFLEEFPPEPWDYGDI